MNEQTTSGESMPNNTDAEPTQQQAMADIDALISGDVPTEKPAVKTVQKKSSPDDEGAEKPTEIDADVNAEGDGIDETPEIDTGDDVVTDEALDEDEKQRRIELYAQDVAMPGGHETTTVGELKNEVLEARAATQKMVDRENDVMQQFNHLMTLKESMPELNNDQVNAINQMQAMQRQKQSAMLIKAIPDWSNERTFTEDKASMVTMLGSYGISEGDLDAVVDHRLIKLAYDYNRLKNRIAKASHVNQQAVQQTKGAKKTRVVTKGKGHKKPAQQTTPARDNLGGNMSDQMNEIEALFES